MNAPANHMIAIASGKGGVGKTWLSVTLAHLCARAGKRVLLFDGDIGLANVDVQLGLTPPRDLSSVLSGKHSFNDAITRVPAGGFDVIAGRSGSASLASLPHEKLERIAADLTAAQRNYDMVFIDLGAGVEQNVQYLASLAARCLVVVTDEPTSLTDGYAFIKIARSGKNPPDIGVVINQAASLKEGEATYHALNKACVNFLNVSPPLYGVIRRDNKVKDAIRNQTSLIIRAPHSTAATDAAALSVKLMQHG
ncbi:MAG: MinD/ParA family protein [Alphaproteobacteria bacterium]|nr:MinD/ParA family protein [Alphaproteobacteria bacterium]